MNALTASCMPSSSGVSIIINNSNSSSPTARAAACTPAQPLRPTAAAHKLRNVQCSCQPRATSKNTSQLDARGLSYLGDSIWSLCVRRHFFTPPKHWRTYQEMVQPYVTAEGQASMYDALLSGAAGATAQERALLQSVRAQVAHWRPRKRFESAAGAEAYRKATAFEALVGHLHLEDPDRLMVLTEGLMNSTAPGDATDTEQG